MKKIWLVGVIALTLTLASFVLAEGVIKYDFDEVEVKYAAEFSAQPSNVSADNWMTEIAGSADKPIKVLYGVVNLKKNGETQISEEFIKVSGQNGSERFLVNSAAYDYYKETSNYQNIKSFFWSAKKLVDNTVVKDFTLPIKSISLFRKFDETDHLYTIALSPSNNGETAANDFWSSWIPTDNVYMADMSTLNEAGDTIATSSH